MATAKNTNDFIFDGEGTDGSAGNLRLYLSETSASNLFSVDFSPTVRIVAEQQFKIDSEGIVLALLVSSSGATEVGARRALSGIVGSTSNVYAQLYVNGMVADTTTPSDTGALTSRIRVTNWTLEDSQETVDRGRGR